MRWLVLTLFTLVMSLYPVVAGEVLSHSADPIFLMVLTPAIISASAFLYPARKKTLLATLRTLLGPKRKVFFILTLMSALGGVVGVLALKGGDTREGGSVGAGAIAIIVDTVFSVIFGFFWTGIIEKLSPRRGEVFWAAISAGFLVWFLYSDIGWKQWDWIVLLRPEVYLAVAWAAIGIAIAGFTQPFSRSQIDPASFLAWRYFFPTLILLVLFGSRMAIPTSTDLFKMVGVSLLFGGVVWTNYYVLRHFTVAFWALAGLIIPVISYLMACVIHPERWNLTAMSLCVATAATLILSVKKQAKAS